MGTVTRALAHGLPLVCVPMGRDQDDVTARVVWHGAGLRVGRGASPAKLRPAVHRVLDEHAFRDQGARLRAIIEADLTADRGIGELEQFAGATLAGESGRSERIGRAAR